MLRREEWFSYLLLVLLGVTFLTLPLWERVARHVGKPKVFAMGALITMAVLLYAFCIEYMPRTVAEVTIWLVAAIAGVGQASLNVSALTHAHTHTHTHTLSLSLSLKHHAHSLTLALIAGPRVNVP